MIALILVLFILLFCITNKVIKNNNILRKMLNTFLSIWGFSLFLSRFNPFGLYQVHDETYMLLLLFVVSFCIGVFSVRFVYYPIRTNYESYRIMSFIESILSNKLFLLLTIFLDIILVYLYVKQQVLLSVYSVAEMRVNIDELLYEGNSMLGLCRNLIITPITPIMTFLATYMLIYDRKHKLSLLIISFFVVVSSLLGGSRGGIMRIFICCIFMYYCKDYLFINKPYRKKTFPTLLIVLLVAFLVLIIMSNMTAQREYNITGFSLEGIKLGVQSLSRHFVTYCLGPFRALDYSFSNNYLIQIGGHTNGSCTFGFVDGMISLVLNNLGINYIPRYSQLSTLLQDNWITIGSGDSFNFAYTALIFFYSDFGILGILIFPIILGRIIAIIANKFLTTLNPSMLIILSYLFTIMIDTIFTWRLYRHDAFVTLVFLFYLYTTSKSKVSV